MWNAPRFVEEFVSVTPDAASVLAERGVLLVGIDYLSIASYRDPAPTHEALLRPGVTILETLDLRAVEPGWWTLTCLPPRGACSAGPRPLTGTGDAGEEPSGPATTRTRETRRAPPAAAGLARGHTRGPVRIVLRAPHSSDAGFSWSGPAISHGRGGPYVASPPTGHS